MRAATRNSRTGFSRQHAVQAVDFNLAMVCILFGTLGLAAPLVLCAEIMTVRAAVCAARGRSFRYPLTMRQVRSAATAVFNGNSSATGDIADLLLILMIFWA